MAFRRRSLIKSIDKLKRVFPAVALMGARQVGKSSLLRLLHEETGGTFVDLERQSDATRISLDPEFFLESVKLPLYIDEAQLLPALFPALRVAIDKDRTKKGRYFLSGSSSPELQTGIEESLAGRIGFLNIEPLTLEEVWGKDESPLYDVIHNGDRKVLESLTQRFTHEELFTSFFFGGYPEPLSLRLNEDVEISLWYENYIKTYIHRDVRSLFPNLDIMTYRRFIEMLAHSSGNILNLSDFARSLSVSQPTVRNYLSIADGTFVWRTLPAYDRSHLKQIIRSPRGHLRDTGLISWIHRLADKEALLNHPLVGRAWEVFITEEIIRNFQNRLVSVKSTYFRSRAGMEIDLILEGTFGTLPIEIKLGSTPQSQDIRWLSEFVSKQKLPYGLLINNAQSAGWLTENIYQLPAGYL